MEFFNNFNKVALIVEYDGRRYHGFQWQSNALTVQAEMEQAIQKVTGESHRVMAASRTDAGVHAKGQVVSFKTMSVLSPREFTRALNYHLPGDIAVKHACRVSADFNVRRDALSREYDYCILNSPTRSPLVEGLVHLVPKELNIDIMNKACQFLEGEHDFASFAASLCNLKSTVRNIYEARVIRKDNLVTLHIVANSFLSHQVRNTMGLLIRVGLGKVGLEEFHRIMEARTLSLAGPTAPPHGLCLIRVNYPSNLELSV